MKDLENFKSKRKLEEQQRKRQGKREKISSRLSKKLPVEKHRSLSNNK